MSRLSRPAPGEYVIDPPDDDAINTFLRRRKVHDAADELGLADQDNAPHLYVKINGSNTHISSYLVGNELLCIYITTGPKPQMKHGRLFFVLTGKGSPSFMRWTLSNGRLYTPNDTDEHFVTLSDQRDLLRRLLAQR